jgi:tetratricopeptide (TPR) repeat protein
MKSALTDRQFFKPIRRQNRLHWSRPEPWRRTTDMTLRSIATTIVAVMLLSSAALAKTPEERLKAGVELLRKNPRRGKEVIGKVAAELEKTTRRQPKDARVHFLLGRAYFYLQQDDRALESYERAIRLDPKNAEYRFMKGVVLRYKKSRKGAIQALQKATKLAPKMARYWYELGDVYYNAKDNKKALQFFEKASRLDPKHAKALFKAGVIYGDQGKRDRAIKYWKRAVAAKPDYVHAHYNLGQAYQIMGQHRKALRHFADVVRLDGRDWRARSKLVQLYQALNKRRERDAQRAKLFAQRKAGANPGLARANSYCRDQFSIGKRKVFAYEHFELKGDFARRYSFKVSDGKASFEISLGSYKSTNEIARGSGSLKKGQRLFHLDGYYDNGRRHQTYGMFKKEPTYDQVKRMVIAVITKKRKATSGTTLHR